jgi:hypothetical protein
VNLKTDTLSEKVLVSNHFYYFGKSAPIVDLVSLGYKNHIGASKLPISNVTVANFIELIEQDYKKGMNLILADPFDFLAASKRVNQATGKII